VPDALDSDNCHLSYGNAAGARPLPFATLVFAWYRTHFARGPIRAAYLMTSSISPLAAGMLVGIVCFAAARTHRQLWAAKHPVRAELSLALAATAMALLWHPPLRNGLAAPATTDSFLTLSPSAAAGLLVVAGTASTLVYLTDAFKCPLIRHLRRHAPDSARLSAGLSLTSALCLSLALSIGAATLAPQLFYTYYRLLWPDLPAQWVIAWPSTGELLTQLLPERGTSLADHGACLLLWCLMLGSAMRWSSRQRGGCPDSRTSPDITPDSTADEIPDKGSDRSRGKRFDLLTGLGLGLLALLWNLVAG